MTSPSAQPVPADLVSRLDDPDPEVRRIAVMELPYCDEDDILPLLLTAMADRSSMRWSVPKPAKAIEGFEEPEAVEALLAMLA